MKTDTRTAGQETARQQDPFHPLWKKPFPVQKPPFPTVNGRRMLLVLLLSALMMGMFLWAERGWICPIRWVTGAACPGCGMTRALFALASGHWQESWYWHPMLIPTMIGMTVLAILFWQSRRFERRTHTQEHADNKTDITEGAAIRRPVAAKKQESGWAVSKAASYRSKTQQSEIQELERRELEIQESQRQGSKMQAENDSVQQKDRTKIHRPVPFVSSGFGHPTPSIPAPSITAQPALKRPFRVLQKRQEQPKRQNGTFRGNQWSVWMRRLVWIWILVMLGVWGYRTCFLFGTAIPELAWRVPAWWMWIQRFCT